MVLSLVYFDLEQADIDYARQLQAKMDAQEARGGGRRASSRVFVDPSRVSFGTLI